MDIGCHLPTQGPLATQQALVTFARKAGRPFDQLQLSLRLPLRGEAMQGPLQAVIDQYCVYKELGLRHLVVDFRRHDLSQMLETLDLVATRIRPAVEAA